MKTIRLVFYMFLVVIFFTACGQSEVKINPTSEPEIIPTVTMIQSTSTPMPTPTPACNITSDLKTEWSTVLCDEFENNQNEWYEASEDNELDKVDISVRDGQYIIDLLGKNVSGYQSGVIHWFPVGNGKNFMVSIDGLIESKYRGVSWGLNFWGNDSGFYSFGIGKEGQYRLIMLKDGDWFYPITTKTNSAIKWDEVNNLAILVDENKFSFYVNGTLLETYESDEILGDEISLFINADAGASAIFKFDNALLRVGD